uniref:Chitin-binding type-2 domain-containing protein n=1 Tax=Anopheles dirus TaxID=7168 RepID=A0A182NDG3_9DIPT
MARRVFSVIVLLGVAVPAVFTQQPSPSSLCDGVEKNSFVPDPENCDKFYQCNGDTYVHGTCPQGMYYHSIEVCSYDASECKTSTPPISTSTEQLSTTSVTSTTTSPGITPPNMDDSADPVEFCLTADSHLPNFIKSPSNCSEYYICVDHKPLLQKCAAGTYWNPAHLYCDDPKEVPCEHDRIINPEDFCSQIEDTELAFTASPINCGDYYVCIKQKPFVMHCAPGSYWNSDAKQCDDPKNSKCKLERDVVRVACCLMLWKKYVILPKTLIVDQFRHLLDSSIQTRQALKVLH